MSFADQASHCRRAYCGFWIEGCRCRLVMDVVGVAVDVLLFRFYYLDEILKRCTAAHGSGYLEDILDRWYCHNYFEEDMSAKGHRILQVDEYHFDQAEDHASRGLDVFSLVTSLPCVYFEEQEEEGVAVTTVME